MKTTTYNKKNGSYESVITLTKDEVRNITDQACKLLYDNQSEDTVLAFEEQDDTIVPVLLTGSQRNGKTDMFPRKEDPSMHIYAHLKTLYGRFD